MSKSMRVREIRERRPEIGPRALRALCALATASLSLACASMGGRPPEEVMQRASYRVGASDKLAISVLPDPPIEREVTVRPDGRFSLDLIGDVDANGKTPEEIAAEIDERMSEYRQSPSTTVSLVEPASTAVAVVGEVGTPSTFPLFRDTRVSEAVAQAGGATQLAAASRVRVIRGEGADAQVYVANLDAIQAGKAESDFVLAPGDLVYVPPATPVGFGYGLRRALYPLEVVLQTLAGPIIGFLIR